MCVLEVMSKTLNEVLQYLFTEFVGFHYYSCNRVYCIHVSGHDPLTFSFRFLFLFDWVGVLWPQLPKVLKPVRKASSVPVSRFGLAVRR